MTSTRKMKKEEEKQRQVLRAKINLLEPSILIVPPSLNSLGLRVNGHTEVIRDRLYRASIRQVLEDNANVYWDPSVDERPEDALTETVLNIQSSMIDENQFQ